MTKYRPNTLKLIRIENKAINKGWYEKHPRTCFSEEVAKKSGELGNEYPSDRAIQIALRMLSKLKQKGKGYL